MSKKHSPASQEEVQQALSKAGLKKTRPREVILRYLMEKHGPFSAKDIHDALHRRELDAVTVYRCLSAFEASSLVRRCDFGDGIARFEYLHDSDHHHHHVICRDCRRIETLDNCEISQQLETRVKGLGYSDVRHVLEFVGVCRDCRKKSA